MENIKSGGKCPLLRDLCIGEVCEWWLKEEDMCAISSVARALNTQKQLV